ncbi:MAG: hypothetical protein ABF449_07835 [Ethanoligenens sp.]|uniref:hypothetical protein n=1 Tax=Ethanoligenens sp. TaxID=2099655 RepID=UPI0039E933DF
MWRSFVNRLIRFVIPICSTIAFASILISELVFTRSDSLFVMLNIIGFALSIVGYNLFALHLIQAILSRQKQKKQDEWANRELGFLLQQTDRMESHQKDMYKLHHDLRNHMGLVDTMLLEGRSKEAALYLRSLLEKLPGGDL